MHIFTISIKAKTLCLLPKQRQLEQHRLEQHRLKQRRLKQRRLKQPLLHFPNQPHLNINQN